MYKIYKNIIYDSKNADKIRNTGPNYIYCPFYTCIQKERCLVKAREIAENGNINIIVKDNNGKIELIEEYHNGILIKEKFEVLIEKYQDMIDNS